MFKPHRTITNNEDYVICRARSIRESVKSHAKISKRAAQDRCKHLDIDIDDSVPGDYRCKACDERWYWDPRTKS